MGGKVASPSGRLDGGDLGPRRGPGAEPAPHGQPRPLAHLNALRAFEAVARHLSVTKAAAELSVTRGAISQQVRLLEAYYGAALLRRHNRKVSLTDAGTAILPDLSLAFDRLAAATRILQEPPAHARLRISAPPSLAALWLVRRLNDFRTAHPGVEVSLESTDRIVALRREGIDLAIRYTRTPDRRLAGTRLFEETLTPVCSPGYLRTHPLASPEDLRDAALIRDATLADFPDFPTWESFLAHAGVGGAPRDGLSVSSSITAIQAALDGHGVVLGRSVLVADELRAGRLVAPFPQLTVAGWAYILVHPPEAPLPPKIAAFRDWLLGTFGAADPSVTADPTSG